VCQGANTDVIYATFRERNKGVLCDSPGTFDFAAPADQGYGLFGGGNIEIIQHNSVYFGG